MLLDSVMPTRNSELSETPYTLRGKTLELTKAYTGRDFYRQTIFTDNVFPYVHLFLIQRKKALKFSNSSSIQRFGPPKRFLPQFFWKQAEYYYVAYQNAQIEIKPLSAYYCMLNAAKAYLTYYTKNLDSLVENFIIHGIREFSSGNQPRHKNTFNILVSRKEKGVFPAFAKNLDKDFDTKWPTGDSYTLNQLLYNLPFVHRSFSATYSKNKAKKIEELFIPLILGTSPRYHKKGGKLHLVAHLQRDAFTTESKATKQKAISPDFNFNDDITIVSKLCSAYNKNSIPQELKDLSDILRKRFVYILNPAKNWYLKRTLQTPPPSTYTATGANTSSDSVPVPIDIGLSTMTINFAIMHRLSEITRYQPEVLHHLFESKESWLLHEYITHALPQFIDEIACEITKRDIMSSMKV